MSEHRSVWVSMIQRLRWRAILLGFAVDYGGSVAYGMISGIAIGVLHASGGGDPAETAKTILASSTYLWSSLIVGSLFVVIGAVVVGWMAPRARLLNGAALGVLDILLGLTYQGQVPGWYHVTCLIVTLPCALLGAWLSGLLFPHYEVPPPPLPRVD